MRIAVLCVGFVLGCGGGSKSSTTPKSEGVTCAAVAGAMVGMMMEGKNQENVAETAEGFTAIIRTRCDADAWTPEARQCLAGMKTRSDAERCSTMLTEEQQSNLVRDQKEKFGAPPEPESTTAAPPPAPAEASRGMGATPPAPKAEDKKKPKSAPKGGKNPKTGDPCDGGE